MSDTLRDLLLRQLAEPEPEREILLDGHVGVEGVVLEHHGDVAFLGREIVDHLVSDPDRPVGDLLEPREHPQCGRLSAARRARP